MTPKVISKNQPSALWPFQCRLRHRDSLSHMMCRIHGKSRENNKMNKLNLRMSFDPAIKYPASRDMKSDPSHVSSNILKEIESPTSKPSQTTTKPPGPTKLGLPTTTTEPQSMSQFMKYVDTSGKLNFTGKAVIDSTGVNFSSGKCYKINLDDFILHEELGRGQFGTVTKVFHQPTNVTMAMKQIRLDLSESAFKQIIMELEILHKSISPYIVEFYGAFFVESAVYYCMEYMDAGSLDRLYGKGLEEPIIARIALDVVRGLHFLKESLSIIHRDVKPSNILINLKGQVKLCDFGVSGQLIKSIAKTNVGCQSYMAPERIIIGNPEMATYTVSADIWSLGLTLYEAATGKYPFESEQYDSVFAQLNAIVNGAIGPLDKSKFSAVFQSFVDQCLLKDPKSRPNYHDLLVCC
jgi:mitogen-activated protein kinase kinase